MSKRKLHYIIDGTNLVCEWYGISVKSPSLAQHITDGLSCIQNWHRYFEDGKRKKILATIFFDHTPGVEEVVSRHKGFLDIELAPRGVKADVPLIKYLNNQGVKKKVTYYVVSGDKILLSKALFKAKPKSVVEFIDYVLDADDQQRKEEEEKRNQRLEHEKERNAQERQGREQAYKKLLGHLETPDSEERRQSAKALRHFREHAVISRLQKVAETDQNRKVRMQSIRTLASFMEIPDSHTAYIKSFLEELMLKDRDEEVRCQSRLYLAQLSRDSQKS